MEQNEVRDIKGSQVLKAVNINGTIKLVVGNMLVCEKEFKSFEDAQKYVDDNIIDIAGIVRNAVSYINEEIEKEEK